VTVPRSLLAYVGKWLEAEANDLGFRPTHPPESIAVVGINGPGETMFYRKRITVRRGRRCAEYESFGGRQVRLWLEGDYER